MRREVGMYLFDVLKAIQSIEEYIGEKGSFEHYESKKLVRRAVERELEIIGEAINRILKIEPDFPIPEARRIVDLRNLVIHAYESVDNVIIWGVIQKDLPILKTQISKLLNE